MERRGLVTQRGSGNLLPTTTTASLAENHAGALMNRTPAGRRPALIRQRIKGLTVALEAMRETKWASARWNSTQPVCSKTLS